MACTALQLSYSLTQVQQDKLPPKDAASSSPAIGQMDAFIVRPPVPPVHLLHVEAHHLQWQIIAALCCGTDQLPLLYICPSYSQISRPQDLDEMMEKCTKCDMLTGGPQLVQGYINLVQGKVYNKMLVVTASTCNERHVITENWPSAAEWMWTYV